jgi:hypothetical protein
LALVPARSPRTAIRFQTFLQQAVAGNLDEASLVLTELFDLSYVRGRETTQAFQQRLRTEPDFVALALRLHFALGAGPSRNAAVLISECFGLSDEESLRAAQAVQARARRNAS